MSADMCAFCANHADCATGTIPKCTAIGEDGEITHDGFEPWLGKYAASEREGVSDV